MPARILASVAVVLVALLKQPLSKVTLHFLSEDNGGGCSNNDPNDPTYTKDVFELEQASADASYTLRLAAFGHPN